MPPPALAQNLLAYMEDFKMARQADKGREIEILPLTGKLIGIYPEDRTKEGEKNAR